MTKIEQLPFFKDDFKGDVLPLGRILFTLKDTEISQLLYLYDNDIYIIENIKTEYAYYKIPIQKIGAIFSKIKYIPIAADFYLFNIFSYIHCEVEKGYNSKYLILQDYEGIFLFENGNYDFVEYKNKYIDNYMHTNDQFEYKISFNGLLQHTKNMLRS